MNNFFFVVLPLLVGFVASTYGFYNDNWVMLFIAYFAVGFPVVVWYERLMWSNYEKYIDADQLMVMHVFWPFVLVEDLIILYRIKRQLPRILSAAEDNYETQNVEGHDRPSSGEGW
jgi:hypothetical protein